ncbi:MAG TPA: hypothetical protein VEG34_09905 [Thermoanaerobaculia bacterium]|nr:hypothetical protein [Thermoanaerobaculia bacterium]
MSNPPIPSDPNARPPIPSREERPTREPLPDKPGRPRPDEPTGDNAVSRGDGPSEHPN